MELYVREVVRRLPELDPRVVPVLLCADCNYASFEGVPGIERHLLEAEAFSRLSFHALARLRLDLWFCPLLELAPLRPGLPAVVTIPDVQHLRYPEFFQESLLKWRHSRFPRSARRADAVLTLSEFSRGEIAGGLGVDAAKVHAIWLDSALGVRASAARLKSVRQRYDLPGTFLYYPANGWPHKNHERLFEALARIRGEGNDCPPLVLTGAEFLPGQWEASIRRLGLGDRVRVLGHVPTGDLPAIYGLARALVFPSLYEGFGLPLVEAMRLGCPVLCSRTTALPEVAGDAACYIDPEDPADLARGIERLWRDAGLRERLRRAGRSRARRFSWQRTVERTLEVLRAIRAAQAGDAPCILPSRPPLVSIITPSYQQGPFIERTLRSVLEQDYPRLQHLVIDGGSSDESLRILERYARRYPGKLDYVSEPDRGQADAVNKGLERAEGEIIGWLNSDDTYAPGCLASVVHAFDQQAGEWVYGRATYVDENDEPLYPYPTCGTFDWGDLAHECFLCQPAVFFRRSLLDRGFRLDADLQLCMDYDLWIRIGRRHRPIFLDRYLVNSRLHPEAKTMNRRDEAYAEIFTTVKKHYGFLPAEWAMGRAHTLTGGDSLHGNSVVSWKGKALTAAFLLRHNWSNPRYLKQLGTSAGRRAVRRLRRGLAVGNARR